MRGTVGRADHVDQAIVLGIHRHPVADVREAVFFKQRTGVITKARIERLELALGRRVNAQLITTGVLRQNPGGQQQECKERKNAFHVCGDVAARSLKGN